MQSHPIFFPKIEYLTSIHTLLHSNTIYLFDNYYLHIKNKEFIKISLHQIYNSFAKHNNKDNENIYFIIYSQMPSQIPSTSIWE